MIYKDQIFDKKLIYDNCDLYCLFIYILFFYRFSSDKFMDTKMPE